MELDPLSPIINGSFSTALAVAGAREEALQRARRAIELDSASPAPHFMMAATLIHLGEAEQAIPELNRARQIAPAIVSIRGLLGYALGVTGDDAAARKILANLDRTALRTGAGVAIARVYLGLGQPDSAAVWMLRAADARDPFFSSETLALPMFDPLRARPDFETLLDKIGLDPALLGPTR